MCRITVGCRRSSYCDMISSTSPCACLPRPLSERVCQASYLDHSCLPPLVRLCSVWLNLERSPSRRDAPQIREQSLQENDAKKANEKQYKEAVATAVQKCADDTKGQTCYICMDGGEEEGLVRGCACRGDAGFAHVSYLARHAQVGVERSANQARYRWSTCGLCKQRYHGVVAHALGWACWKTYVDGPEGDELYWHLAMTELGNGLSQVGRHELALSVRESQLSMLRRLGTSEESLLTVKNNLAGSYASLGRHKEAIDMYRDIRSGIGEEYRGTLSAAFNLAASLRHLGQFKEAKALLRETLPAAQRVLGESHDLTLKMRWDYAKFHISV